MDPKKRRPRDRALGERLRTMRARWGETQLQFSRHFPVSRQSYVGWERAGVPPGAPAAVARMVLAKLGDIARKRERAKA